VRFSGCCFDVEDDEYGEAIRRGLIPTTLTRETGGTILLDDETKAEMSHRPQEKGVILPEGPRSSRDLYLTKPTTPNADRQKADMCVQGRVNGGQRAKRDLVTLGLGL